MTDISASAIKAAGGEQLSVAGPGIYNPASGLVTVRKTPEPAAPQAKPVTGNAKIAANFVPPSDILVKGVKPWIRAQQARHRQPRHYFKLRPAVPKMAPQPKGPAQPSPLARTRMLQNIVQTLQPKPVAALTETISVKMFPRLNANGMDDFTQAKRPGIVAGCRRKLLEYAM